jgi:glycosyltransferase involved in cell wall biosynthesis
MTCHNGEAFLDEAVRSIINQTYLNWELIFYDNYSNDKSREILSSFKEKRIKKYKTDKIVNLGTVRNLAYSKCNGSFICFLDVDDYWSEEKLEKQIRKFELNNKTDVVYSNFFRIEKDEVNKNKMDFYKGFLLKEIMRSYFEGSPLTPWLTLMIKKSSIDQLGHSFDIRTHISSDFDLIIRLAEFSNFDYVEECLAYYRLHENNESKNNNKEVDDLVYIIWKHQKNKILNKLFFYRYFAQKIYFKYLIFKKFQSIDFKEIYIIRNITTMVIYYLIKIIPLNLLKLFIKI